MKEFADDNFKFGKTGRKLSKQVENIVGKGEIARYEQFLFFPQCFQKPFFPEVSKGVIVWEWVKDPKKEDFRKLWEKEKMLVTSIFPFPTVFFTLSKREIVILAMFKLSSANAFNLVTSTILSFSKELSSVFSQSHSSISASLFQVNGSTMAFCFWSCCWTSICGKIRYSIYPMIMDNTLDQKTESTLSRTTSVWRTSIRPRPVMSSEA